MGADHSFLKRNVDINDDVGKSFYLLSDLSAGVTGEIHFVDAGYNKSGMPDPKNFLTLQKMHIDNDYIKN